MLLLLQPFHRHITTAEASWELKSSRKSRKHTNCRAPSEVYRTRAPTSSLKKVSPGKETELKSCIKLFPISLLHKQH